MKINLFSIFFILIINFYINKAYSNNTLYNSEIYQINITSENIYKEKNVAINKAKKNFIKEVFSKTLLSEKLDIIFAEFLKHQDVDYLIKNIIIDNEIVTNEKYIADLKIFLDNDKLKNYYRNNKLNYSDIFSPNFMVVAIFDDLGNKILWDKKQNILEITKKSLSKNFNLLNFTYPNGDYNDKYLISYNDIETNNISKTKIFLKKYKLENAIIYKIKKTKNIFNTLTNFDVSLYIYIDDEFKLIYENNYHFGPKFFDKVLEFIINESKVSLSDWWINYNLIDNNFKNTIFCSIKYSEIEELKNIKSKILFLSQIKSLILNDLILGKSIFEINYYGNIETLKNSMLYYDLNMNIKNKCEITKL